jgi:hypothetical protein
MKIADSQSIKAGEKEMILSIMKKIDPQVLAAIATQDLSPENMEFVTGDMVVVDNRIVYQMNFKVTVDMKVMFDREGNLVMAGGEDAADSGADLAEALEEEGEAGFDDEDIIDLVEANDADSGIEGPEEDPKVSPAEEDSDNMEAILQRNKDFWSRRNDGGKD